MAQPTASVANDVGHEAEDEALFTGGACPVGKNCRYSDAAFIDTDPLISVDNGKIARTLALGDKTVDTSDPQWNVTAESPGGSLALNNELQRNGITSGWRAGDISNTCAPINVSGSSIRFLCQYAVFDTHGGSGDSGGPVFDITNSPSTDDVAIMGVMWGTTDDVNGNVEKFWFSELGQIYFELGVSVSWDSCSSGC
jgi:hypothetical protein